MTESATLEKGRILVVQGGMERSDTLDVIHSMAPSRIDVVDDVYEAVARVGLSTARNSVETVVLPITIPDFSASRLVEAFRIGDRRVRLVLLAPDGRTDAIARAIDAGFEDAVEIPASRGRLSRALAVEQGLLPDRTVEIERADLDAAAADPDVPSGADESFTTPTTARDVLERAAFGDPIPAAPTRPEEFDAPPLADEEAESQPGDIDLVAAVMANDDSLRAATLAIIRSELGTRDVHLLLPDEEFGGDGRAAAEVIHTDRHLGTLVSSTIGSVDLERWASWLGVWLGLDQHVQDLERLTETDELTGAGNRRAFERILEETLSRARKERRVVSLMVFDIDDFKLYNDLYGHEAGDQVLRETVELLRCTIRRGDHVFRIGGDEFVVIFSDEEGPREEHSAPLDSVEAIAHRFQAKVCELRFPQLGMDAEGSLSISAGLATFPWDGHDGPSLLRHADTLTLESKRAGKNALRFGSGVSRRHRENPPDRNAPRRGEGDTEGS